ncbi:MAG: hypothetical protein HKN93_07460 [Acidimicrobiia bacterium]|nr:hypothetical protein [Acidimicrobiia bacterium]
MAGAESGFVAEINAERAANGLEPLEVYWDLVDDARAHSQVMLDGDDLHHNPNLGSVTTGWYSLGENVGVGPSVSSLHTAFMNSAGHRANILGDYNYVGVGVVVETDTKMWVTVVFMSGPEGLVTPPEPEPAPEPEPTPEPAPEPEPTPEPEPAPEPEPKPAPAPAPTTERTTPAPVADVKRADPPAPPAPIQHVSILLVRPI